MSADRELIVKPLGLITQPNEKGQFPPGAMRQAQDWIMRSPGVLENPFRDTTLAAVASGTIYGLFATRSQALQLVLNGATWGIHWVNGATVTAATLQAVTSRAFSQVGRSNAIRFRDRIIINPENSDPLTADYDNPSSTAERTFRFAGLPQVQVSGSSNNVEGTALDPGTCVSYSANAERHFSDGYIVIGPMSLFSVKAYNNLVATDVYSYPVTVYWTPGSLTAGDVVRVYRSQAVEMEEGTLVGNPGTTVYQVHEHTLTSGEAAAGSYSFVDYAEKSNVGDPLGGLGEEAYTNPGQQGLTSSKVAPPVAACTCSYNGRAIYGNLRFPASFSFSVRAGYGSYTASDSAAELLAGVGAITFTGDVVAGATTITNIDADVVAAIVVGQELSDGGSSGPFSGSAFRFVSGKPTSTSITITGSGATGTVAGWIYSARDVLEVDGTLVLSLPGIFDGGQLARYRCTSTRPLNGFGRMTNLQVKLTPQRYEPPATLNLRGTRGYNYDPPIPEIGETPLTIQPTHRKNKIMYSEDQQPEAVPEQNEFDVGSGEIYALVPTRDAVWCFASDGLWRISGTFARIDGFPDIRVDMFDPTCFLAAPRAWCVLRDAVFAWTNRGFVQITDNGVKEISEGVIGDLIPGRPWTEATTPYLVADEAFDEVFIVTTTFVIRYSLRYGCFLFSTQFGLPGVGVYYPPSRAVLFGASGGSLTRVAWDESVRESSITPIFQLQPIYGNRPDGLKQFIDVTVMFDASGSLASQVSLYCGLDPEFAGTQSMRLVGDDYRVSFGVPRDAPAIAASLIAQLQLNNAPLVLKFSGVSFRYVPITEQQGVR